MGNRGQESQMRILAFIKQEIEQRGYPPSVREICHAVGLTSTATVHGHLNA
ncbi:MAG: repressor LexA, partial [Clostridia bacterium]